MELEKEIVECGYKEEIDCSPEERKLRMREGIKCALSFIRFLLWCKIVDPPTLGNPGGVISFQLWPHLVEVIKSLLTEQLIVVMKSRQIGLSWLLAAYALWYAMFRRGANIMMFSKGEGEAMELLGKCYRIYNQLPPFLKLKVDPKSATEMGFPTMMSSIKAFAATETAGISYTASVVMCDEWEEHPYADANYLSSKPTRDAGGQFIGCFTVNKTKPDTLAKAIFRDADEGKNDFVAHFFPWQVRPGRDAGWYEKTKRNIPTRELAVLTPELYMEQNYPNSIDEALRMTQSISAFSHEAIDEMMGDVRNPVNDDLIIHIFKPYHIGEWYIAASDTSHGIGKDYSVTTVMNVQTGEVVADVFNNRLSPEEFALQSVNMLKLYQTPLWFIESNDWGGVTIATAQRLGYKNFGYQDSKRQKIGFSTHGYATSSGIKGSRTDLFGGLIPAMNNRQIKIYNSDGLKQFYDIIRVVEKNGKIEAMGGRHDDYPIAVGICWVKRDEVSVTVSNKPVESLTFRREGIPVATDGWTKLLEA